MAPAANASVTGRTGASHLASSRVAIAATGSTAPESAPMANAPGLLMPWLRSGREMIAPSGKF